MTDYIDTIAIDFFKIHGFTASELDGKAPRIIIMKDGVSLELKIENIHIDDILRDNLPKIPLGMNYFGR